MCYLVAKDRDAHGCFALKTTHGRHLVESAGQLRMASTHLTTLWIRSRSFRLSSRDFVHEIIMPCGQRKLQEFTRYILKDVI